jgi:hypothetical protein
MKTRYWKLVVRSVLAMLMLAPTAGVLYAQAQNQPSVEWYFSVRQNRDYEGLAEDAFDQFRRGEVEYGSPRSKSEPSFGIGSTFMFNSWSSVDVNLATSRGSSTIRSFGDGPSASSITSDFRVYEASAALRLYTVKRPRWRHWIYVGALSALARPTGGEFRSGTTVTELSSQRFDTTTTFEPMAGVGLEFPVSARINPGIVIRHSPRGGWSAGALLSIPIAR